MDWLYQTHADPNSPIDSGSKVFYAAVARAALSMVMSIFYMAEPLWQEFQRILPLENIWGFCLVLLGWFLATIVGGWLGAAINALLIVYGVIELWDRLKHIYAAGQKWLAASYAAQSEADLEVAAKYFAEAASVGLLTAIELIVTSVVFRAIAARLIKRFPVPEWLRTRHQEAVRRRTERTQPLGEKVFEATQKVPPGVRLAGGEKAAGEFPVGPVVAVVAALGVAAVGIGLLAASSSSRRSA